MYKITLTIKSEEWYLCLTKVHGEAEIDPGARFSKLLTTFRARLVFFRAHEFLSNHIFFVFVFVLFLFFNVELIQFRFNLGRK